MAKTKKDTKDRHGGKTPCLVRKLTITPWAMYNIIGALRRDADCSEKNGRMCVARVNRQLADTLSSLEFDDGIDIYPLTVPDDTE